MRNALARNLRACREWCERAGVAFSVPEPTPGIPWKQEALLQGLRQLRRHLEVYKGIEAGEVDKRGASPEEKARARQAKLDAKRRQIEGLLAQFEALRWLKPMDGERAVEIGRVHARATRDETNIAQTVHEKMAKLGAPTGSSAQHHFIESAHGLLEGWCRQNGLALPSLEALKRQSEAGHDVQKRLLLVMDALNKYHHTIWKCGQAPPEKWGDAITEIADYSNRVRNAVASLARQE